MLPVAHRKSLNFSTFFLIICTTDFGLYVLLLQLLAKLGFLGFTILNWNTETLRVRGNWDFILGIIFSKILLKKFSKNDCKDVCEENTLKNINGSQRHLEQTVFSFEQCIIRIKHHVCFYLLWRFTFNFLPTLFCHRKCSPI